VWRIGGNDCQGTCKLGLRLLLWWWARVCHTLAGRTLPHCVILSLSINNVDGHESIGTH
jgi:hypothetical protein